MSVLLESRSFRPFKSSEEYLYAMKEDLAEWLSGLYPDLYINVMNFMDRLDTGVALCKHANAVRKYAEEYVKRRCQGSAGRRLAGSLLGVPGVRYLPGAKPGTFFARDNVSNFITWCRKGLGVIECLLFETDDLIMRKNEKHVILCLLEVARRGARLGMPAPMLVQLEREIDREIAADKRQLKRGMSQHEIQQLEEEASDDDDDDDVNTQFGPLPQIVTNDLKSLDEMVRDLVEKCTCPTQFPMIRVSEGKYRIGDTKVLIFVRVLRSHVMVRVGGGWDTLAHYLDKHDPCRCKTAHRAPVSTKVVGMRMGGPAVELTHAQVHYDRSPPRTRRSSASSIGSNGGNSLSVDSRTLSPRKSSSSDGNGNLDRERSVSPAMNTQTLSPSTHHSRTSTLASRQRSRSPSQQRSRSPTPRTTYLSANNAQSADNASVKSRSRSPTPRRASSCQPSSKNRSRSTTPMRAKQPNQETKHKSQEQQQQPLPQLVLSPLPDRKDALKEELIKQISVKQSSLPLDIEAQVQQYQLPPPTDSIDSGVDTSPAHKVSDNFTNITKITINPAPSSPSHPPEVSSGVDTTPSRKISENFDVPEQSKKPVKYGSINALDSFGADPHTNNDSGSEVSDEGYRSLGIVNTSTPGSNAVTTPQGSPVRVARVVRSRSLGGHESPPPPPPPTQPSQQSGSASVCSSPFRRHTPASRSARHPSHQPRSSSSSVNRTWNSGSKKQRPTISSDTFCKQVADIMQQYAAMMPSPRKDSKPDSGITRIPAPVHKT
ncbi:GAS2-like protein pickled eggs [Nilaparvata lugens]|uniref:GAS2-like protein pickled eggs n=1 Tax=Nilaparvata lugens TaxID=108931 RepID=UPI00193D900D|nr:GAS2-like protein pickled eggs [Nilaparvata lugens]